MQKVFLWSSVTYERTQVTPSSAFVPTTDRQACAPLSVKGISSPSGNERSTMNLAMRILLALFATQRIACDIRLWRGRAADIRENAQVVLRSVLISRQPGGNLDAGVEPQLVQDVLDMVVHSAH